MLGFISIPDFTALSGTTTALHANGAVPSGLAYQAQGMWNALAPIALAIAGIVIGVLLIKLFVIKGLVKGVKGLTGRR